ncbi:hypothetical protein BB560_005527, partial [Smittium megazygosporum]
VVNASKALLEIVAKEAEKSTPKNSLFEAGPESIYLNISTKSVSTDTSPKPFRIPLKTPLYKDETSVCLITVDANEAIKDQLSDNKIPFIRQLISLTELKKSYKPYEAKRALLTSHTLFMADDRVIPSLPKLIGTKFFKAKKQPIPVSISGSNIKPELENALNSTYLFETAGSLQSIKIASSDMSPEQISDNIISAIPHILKRIPKKSKNVRAVFIKSLKSLALPIYEDTKPLKKAKPSTTAPSDKSDIPLADLANLAQPKPLKSTKKRKSDESQPSQSTPDDTSTKKPARDAPKPSPKSKKRSRPENDVKVVEKPAPKPRAKRATKPKTEDAPKPETEDAPKPETEDAPKPKTRGRPSKKSKTETATETTKRVIKPKANENQTNNINNSEALSAQPEKPLRKTRARSTTNSKTK